MKTYLFTGKFSKNERIRVGLFDSAADVYIYEYIYSSKCELLIRGVVINYYIYEKQSKLPKFEDNKR